MKLVKKEIGKYSNEDYQKPLSIKDLEKKRNKILVYRKWGGVGDIINTRMIFKNIKDLNPEFNITYAVPSKFHDLLNDLPYIDNLIDCKQVRIQDYGYCSDISTDCGTYESAKRPNIDKQRAEIWSFLSLGINTDKFEDFYFRLDEKNTQEAKEILKNYNPDIKIAIFPKTASPIKDIPDDTLLELIDKLKQNGYFPAIIHSDKSLRFLKDTTYIHSLNFKQFIHVTSLFDYVISCDTGSFHLTYSLPKQIPTLGIFGWTDGDIIGKYHNKFINLQLKNGKCSCSRVSCWDWPSCEFYKDRTRPKKIPVPCISEITSDVIYENLLELMKRYPKC